jgi:hypothetical protein
MPMQIVKGNKIAHLGKLTNGPKGDAINVIHKLTYSDIWRGARTLHAEKQMRLDMQGTIAEITAKDSKRPAMQNLQVQTGPNSVAHVNVSHDLQTNDEANQVGVVRKVKTALRRSLDDGCTYWVTGTVP